MKQQQSIALSAMIAVAVGLSGISIYADSVSQPTLSEMELLAVESGIFGHLEVVQTNADGEIIAYRQTDNTILNEGVECAVEILFAGIAISGNNCDIASPSGAQFDVIQLITTGTPDVDDKVGAIDGNVVLVSGQAGLNLSDGQCVVADAAGNGSVTCTQTFNAGSAVSSFPVAGAYLTDATTGEATYFAGSVFTSVSMTDGDSLQVTWTLTLS